MCDFNTEGNSEIVCFYETEKSSTALKDRNGDWSMTGLKLLALKYHWMVPFERNEGFVGREDILRLLLERIPPGTKPDACQRTVIEGLGGVGKTQIALETAYRLRDTDASCSVLWVPTVDSTTFENAYRDIGRLIGVAGLDDDKANVKALVRAALNDEDRGRWLLIIDNADDPELIFGPEGLSRYLPRSMKGSILFTTRTREVTERLDVHPVGVIKTAKMNREEAREMLRTRLMEGQVQDTASTDGLLDFLDDLPLAIRQASAYMRKTGITITRYLGYCRSSDATSLKLLSRDFEDRGRYETSKNPVAMTWLISFDHILRDNPRAGEYLQFICLLSEKDIPISLLPQATDELEADEAIGILEAYAFVTKREMAESMDMHRLVRLAMRNWLRIQNRFQETYHKVILRLDTVYPFPKHENREIWMRYTIHGQSVLQSDEIYADSRVFARLLLKVAESLYRQGHYQGAAKKYRQTVDIMERVLGKEHPSTLGSMHDLGLMLRNMGEYSESEQISRQTLELMEKMFGKKHPFTLISTINLGVVLDGVGQHLKAKQIYQ
ncbi:hypothetical protein ACHAQD_011016 [Fusarium lateritium]